MVDRGANASIVPQASTAVFVLRCTLGGGGVLPMYTLGLPLGLSLPYHSPIFCEESILTHNNTFPLIVHFVQRDPLVALNPWYSES